MTEKITIEVNLDDEKLSSNFKSIEKGLGDAGDKGGEEAAKGFSDSFQGVIESFLGNLLSDLFQGFVKDVNSQLSQIGATTSKLEVFETQFKVLLGSAKAAQNQIEDLQNFAATTPFKIDGISLATRQLLSFGVAQKNIIPTLRNLGDLAAGTGSQIQDLTIPFGRLIATQKLTLVELDKFSDRGINIYKELADQTGASIKDIRDEISKGRIPFEEFTKAIGSLTGPAGKFFQATIQQSKTLSGVTSTLDDAFFNLRGSIGQIFRPILVQNTIDTIGIVNRLTESIKNNAKAIQSAVFSVGQFLVTNFLGPIQTVFKAARETITMFAVAAIDVVSIVIDQIARIPRFLSNFSDLSDNPLIKSFLKMKDSVKESTGDIKESILSISKDVGFDIEEQGQKFLDDIINLSKSVDSAVKEGSKDIVIGIVTPSEEDEEKAKQKINDIALSISRASAVIQTKNFAIGASFKTSAKDIVKASQQIAVSIKNAFVNSVTSSFQTFANNLVAGKNLFEGFGKSIMGILGDMAIAIGKTAILAGITIESLFGLQGAQAVAAGAALIAIGSVLKSISGSGGASLAGGGGGSAPTIDNGEQFGAPSSEDIDQGPTTVVTLNVQGDILDSQDTPRRLADLLNAGFDTEGLVLKGTA